MLPKLPMKAESRGYNFVLYLVDLTIESIGIPDAVGNTDDVNIAFKSSSV